jgi:hypothetical protein
MSWNYRIVKRCDGSYGLHEVFYDDASAPRAMTERPIHFETNAEEGPAGIVASLEMALKDARERPVFEMPVEWTEKPGRLLKIADLPVKTFDVDGRTDDVE